MYYFNVKNPKTEDMTQYVGYIKEKKKQQHWAGHAFGYDFLEYGVSLEVFREYWASLGKDYLKPGDKIGVCALIETPIDGWGSDFSPRGEMTVPEAETDNGINLEKKGIASEDVSLPSDFRLNQNYPNPFNPETTIRFSLPEESEVLLEIYNSAGQLLETLVNKRLGIGHYNITWNAINMPSGIYFYRIKTSRFIDLKKMILLR
jgi:hypothetical protein